MTTNPSFDVEITSSRDFEAVLQQLLLESLRNDIDPRGSWVYRTDGTGTDLEVMVTELEPKEPTD